jgi:2-polyprenyl-3-methyl-5-hydroxy-6-metoxy-1,4-benzoquinol methylase
MKIATFLRQLKYIRQFVNSGKALDIGCATGYFLEAAQSQGFDPYGIELSEYSASIAKRKFGDHKIFNGKLEDCDFKPEQFASISMFDLLEHVRSPLQTLTKAAELLDKNGVILVTTPDNSSFSNKLMGKKWTHYKLEHFFYFNSKSLHLLAQQSGLKVAGEWKSKKALNLLYLRTQLNVYKHWLLTPAINFLCFILPAKLVRKNFYISIGEITVAFRK